MFLRWMSEWSSWNVVAGDDADVAGRVFGQLCRIPRDAIPPLPEDWPADGETADFARRLSAITAGLREFPAGVRRALHRSRDPREPARSCPQTLNDPALPAIYWNAYRNPAWSLILVSQTTAPFTARRPSASLRSAGVRRTQRAARMA